ncbi:MAG: hypothetical protein KAJ62_06365 [Desulfobacteraceae bacterium]|nr:hypothetical protein [Desulfobacteraceae bacterium]
METKNKKKFETICQITGWMLFIVSALFFMASSFRSGDLIGFLGGSFFLVACFVFLIPYIFPGHSN